MANTFKTFVDKLGGTPVSSYVGKIGELFYDPTTTTLRISDGSTPGGIEVSGGEGGVGHDADKLTAGSRTATLDLDGTLTFNAGTARISTAATGNSLTVFAHNDMTISTAGGDDINVNAGDTIRLQGGNKTGSGEGGIINLYAGDGGPDSGVGGNINIRGGSAGNATGVGTDGGAITIGGGDASGTTLPGGKISIFGGNGGAGVTGAVEIGSGSKWIFTETDKIILCPITIADDLPSPVGKAGARTFISDSSSPAFANFGALVVGGGTNKVPVFSDGANWLIG